MARRLLYLLCCLSVSACEKTPLLDRIKNHNELIVLTRNSPTTYYEGIDGPMFENLSGSHTLKLSYMGSASALWYMMKKENINFPSEARCKSREWRFLTPDCLQLLPPV